MNGSEKRSAVSLITARPGDMAPRDWEEIGTLLDAGERRQLDRLVHRQDQDSYALAHALRRCALSCELRIAPEAVQFASTRQGAPRLSGMRGTIHFSHSHCRTAVAVAVTRIAAIGVDVEPLGHVQEDDLQAFVESPWGGIDHGPTQPSSTHRWTALEAYWKARGIGLSETNPRIRLSRWTDRHCEIRLPSGDRQPPAATAFWIDSFDDCALALVLDGGPPEIAISRTHCKSALDIKQLCRAMRSAKFQPTLNMVAQPWCEALQ